MKKQYILLALAFGITAATLPAGAADMKTEESPFKACADVTFISKSDYKKDSQFWQEAIACGADVQILPDSGFFAGVLRSLESKTGFAGDKLRNEEFLRKIGAKAGEYLDQNIALNSAIAACARGDQAFLKNAFESAKTEDLKKLFDPKNCDSMLDDVKDVAEKYGPKVRVEYALTKKLQSVFGLMGDYLKFDSLGMKTELDKAQLSEKEQKEVDARFAEIEKRMKAKFDKEMAEHEKLRAEAEKFAGGEAAAFDGYAMALNNRLRGEESEIIAKEFMGTLQKAPMLAYAAKPGRLSNEDLANAMGKIVQNGVNEKKKITDALAQADGTATSSMPVYDAMGNVIGTEEVKGKRPAGANERTKTMMEFMSYGPVLEEVLKADPSFCGNATKLANAVQGDKNKRLVVGITATVAGAVATGGLASALGATAAIGTAASSAVALGASGALIYAPDYQAMKSAKERGYSVAHTEEGSKTAGKAVGDVKEFEEARDAFALDIATLPLDFTGFGIFKGGKNLVLAGKDAALVAKLKFLDKPLAVNAAKKALAKGGLSELQIAKVLTDLKSADGVVSGRALTQVAKALDIDTNEVKVLKNLYRTGVVPEVDTRASSRALARLRAVPAEQRAATYQRLEDTLANLNTAKINAANRDQAMEAMVAASQFGADPKRVAAVVTDWEPGGLDGLARAYDVARKKMELPDVRGLASAEAKQEAAFGKALDELMEANPEFKALKAEDRLAARSQMMGCGLKGK